MCFCHKIIRHTSNGQFLETETRINIVYICIVFITIIIIIIIIIITMSIDYSSQASERRWELDGIIGLTLCYISIIYLPVWPRSRANEPIKMSKMEIWGMKPGY